MESCATVYTAIKPEAHLKALQRAMMWGAAGGGLLFVTGVFLPLEQLQVWGPVLFLVGITCIAIGLIPYRRLAALLIKPNKLVVDEELWQFIEGDRKLFSIPSNDVGRVEYVEDPKGYGIAILLKNPANKIQVHSKAAQLYRFQSNHFPSKPPHLYLPYFSQRAYLTLNNLID